MLNPNLIKPLPGADLLQPNSATLLAGHLKPAEFVAANTGQAICLLGLQPEVLLYSSHSCALFTGTPVSTDCLPLHVWTGGLRTCSGIPMGADVRTYMYALATRFAANADLRPMIVLDYCAPMAGGRAVHLEVQIFPLALQQRFPKQLFVCTFRNVDHLPNRFTHELRLVENGNTMMRKVFSPPVTSHPLLAQLTGTELRVVQSLFHKSRGVAMPCDRPMAIETLKRHRKNIIHKTGFASTDALIAVLERELR